MTVLNEMPLHFLLVSYTSCLFYKASSVSIKPLFSKSSRDEAFIWRIVPGPDEKSPGVI